MNYKTRDAQHDTEIEDVLELRMCLAVLAGVYGNLNIIH